MALILAAANGDFNTGATWVGGVVPGPGDEARPAGFTVAITSNITCDLLHNPTGGYFSWQETSVITANVQAGTADCLKIEPTGDNKVFTFIGNAIPSTTTASVRAIRTNTSITTWTFNFTGNATAGISTGRDAILINQTGIVNINGNLYGTSRVSTGGLTITAGSPTVTLNGTIVGGTTLTGGHGLYSSGGTPYIYCYSHCIGGQEKSIFISQTTGGAYLYFYGTYTQTTDRATVIQVNVDSFLIWKGNITNYNGQLPFVAWRVLFLNEEKTIKLLTTDLLTEKTFYTSGLVPTSPAQSDVRDQVVYGMNNELTGTMKVAPPASVALGVPTDDTVGSALITPESLVPVIRDAIWNALTSEFSEENSFGNIIREIYLMYGLVKGSPLMVKDNSRIVGEIEQTIEDDGETTTVTRL